MRRARKTRIYFFATRFDIALDVIVIRSGTNCDVSVSGDKVLVPRTTGSGDVGQARRGGEETQ